MDCRSTPIPYTLTRKFSPFIADYLGRHADLAPFYVHPPTPEAVVAAMNARDAFPTDRKMLVEVFSAQYEGRATDAQQRSIQSLLSPGTYTITTAHQPNIFTGYLYLVYKILHVIKLAEDLRKRYPGKDFVPVYYIGSEDNDLEELGQVTIDGNKLVWDTKQKGAVGRMKVDKPLLALLDRIEGQLGVEAHGREMIAELREVYQEGRDIASATARIIDAWMGQYGLLVLQPDVASLKKLMVPLFKKELLESMSFPVVSATTERIGERYKTQIHPREINLFYLETGVRERITRHGDMFHVEHTDLRFSEGEMLTMLEEHPERFSPNVVLRPIYQSTILPDIIFVGGGAELAYWMQLSELFREVGRPFPMLMLRNSFLLLNRRQEQKLERIGFSITEFFQDTRALSDEWVSRHSGASLSIEEEKKALSDLYASLSAKAGSVDKTLLAHVSALGKAAEKGLEGLEKKLVRAEKRKYADQLRQLESLHEELFPGNGLQERVENILPFMARHGKEIISVLYRHSFTFEQEFNVLTGL